MKICETNQCTGCEACVQVCPVNCITMKASAEGFFYPITDESKCIKCKKCVKTCPNNSEVIKRSSNFYMGWHKDTEVLRNSSSGGAFTAIADYVFDRHGVVFGAYFDDERHTVYHVTIEKKEDLNKVRLSKYFQGRIFDSYKNVKEFLDTGRLVLFSGTACQIAGLYAYLGCNIKTKPENLVTIDILCHGVTSKKVVDAYIKSKERKYRKKISTFRFRLKPDQSDWMEGGGTRMRLDFVDGTSKVQNKGTDTFFVGFNNYLFLRENCYQCRYTGEDRIADFTLADFWGVPLDKIPEKQRKYGVSLVLTNTEQASRILKELTGEFYYKEIDRKLAIPYNQSLKAPGEKDPNRDNFFQNLDQTDFDKLVHKYCKDYFIKRRIKDNIYKILGKKRTDNVIRNIKGILHKK